MTTATPTGLDGISVADTALCHIDGAHGELIVRGWPIDRLAGHIPFEGITALLWHDVPPDDTVAAARLRKELGIARERTFEPVTRVLAALSADAQPMHQLAAAAVAAASDDAIDVTAAVGVATAAIGRRLRGESPIAPDAGYPHAADLLRMLGHDDSSAADALDAYMVTVAEHSLNASTFTARVIASTAAGTAAAVAGAAGALKGPLHGGAPGPVLDMLDAIGTAGRAEDWLRGELAAGRRLMGFGHRVYRVRDPRADVLRDVVRRLGDRGRLTLAEQVEVTALRLLAEHKPDRRLDTNVEFYTALVLETVGIPRPLFTAVFAAARVAGWCAHIEEQVHTGRLLRPTARYVGRRPQQ